MNPLLLTIPVAVCVASASAHAEPAKAVRGLASQIEVEYAPRLRARADQTPNSPILVRVSPGQTAGRQRIEFIGAVAGSFDLRDHLEREDGQPIDATLRIPITVVSNLPADQGPDLYGSTGSWMNWRAYYRELMWGAAALWIAVPITVLIVRAIRRPRVAPPPRPPPPPPVHRRATPRRPRNCPRTPAHRRRVRPTRAPPLPLPRRRRTRRRLRPRLPPPRRPRARRHASPRPRRRTLAPRAQRR